MFNFSGIIISDEYLRFLRHSLKFWKGQIPHIHKFQELKYGPGDSMYVVGSDVSTAHVNEEPRGRLCSVSSRSSRIFFFQSTFRAWYPVRRDAHRRRPSLPLYCTRFRNYTPTHFEFTTCGLWPSLFSFHRTSHWLSTIDTRYSRQVWLSSCSKLSTRVHAFDACVRACVVRRRRTRDGNADRPVDGPTSTVASANFRSQTNHVRSSASRCVLRKVRLHRDQIRRGQIPSHNRSRYPDYLA